MTNSIQVCFFSLSPVKAMNVLGKQVLSIGPFLFIMHVKYVTVDVVLRLVQLLFCVYASVNTKIKDKL